MSETELPEAPAPEQDELDEDDRLRPEFVDAVRDAVADGDDEAARALVEPLHPADIADLFELTPHEDRGSLAKALTDLLDARRSELRNRRQALQVRSAQYQSTVGLIRALGGGWSV